MATGIEYDAVIRAEEEEREIWVKHYCSSHQILLVGEGDFSFSLSLAHSFGSASNIVASSLDSFAELIKKYKQAKSNLVKLVKLGAYLLHEVDAPTMKLHTDLKMRKFDRIIFNFPHAGFHGKEDSILLITKHRKIVHGFFRNARGMLRANGEIHVNRKTTTPFNLWNLEELASQNSLALIERVDFKAEDYPGYNNKKGDGLKSDDPFPLGACSTYKFGFSPQKKKMQNFVETPIEMVRQPIAAVPQPMVPYQFRHPQTNFAPCVSNIPGYVVSQPTVGNSLALIERVDFKAEDYPGYNNKKDDGLKSDDPFPLGACSTYKFGFSPHTKKMQNFVETPIETVRQPIAAVPRPMVPYQFRYPQTNFTPYAINIPGYVVSQPTVGIRSECSRIFRGYFSPVMETFGRNGCYHGDVYNSVHESWFCNVHGRSGRYRTLNLEELHRCSDSRLAWLERTSVSHHQ